jgi:hypothetical protein
MRRRTYLPLLLVGATGLMACAMAAPAGAAGSGNGVANMSANQIADAASSALTSATSFSYGGTVSTNGKSNVIQISLNSSGDGHGTIGSSGQPVKIIKTGSNLYINSNAAFWTKNAGADAGKSFANRWIAIASDNPQYAGLAPYFNPQQVPAEFLDTSSGAFTKGKTSTVDGQKVIAIRGKDANQRTVNTIYVATTGKPYIVKITAPGGNGQTLAFSGYNKPVNPTAPSNPILVPSSGSTSTTG